MTYSTTEDVEAHYPFTFSASSRPTESQVNTFRSQANSIINGYLRIDSDTTDTYGDLKTVEISLVNRFIDNYYARYRGERTAIVELTENHKRVLRAYQNDHVGHYAINVP